MLNRRSLISLAPATVAATAVGGCRGDPTFKLVGKTLPDMNVTYADGSGVNLAKLAAPALIRFWGLWCPVCERDEEHWQDVIRVMKGRGPLQVLTVHSGPVPSSSPDLETWSAAQAEDVKVPVVDDTSRRITKALDIPGVPVVLVCDRRGKIFETSWAFGSTRGVRSFISKTTYALDRWG